MESAKFDLRNKAITETWWFKDFVTAELTYGGIFLIMGQMERKNITLKTIF